MSVRIRLRRMGAKKRPFYRIVVADSRTARGGRFIDQLGYYDPTTEPPTMKLDTEKAKMWLGRGAQPSDTARGLLKKIGIIEVTKPEEAKPEPVKKAEEAPKKRQRKTAVSVEKPAASAEKPAAKPEKAKPEKAKPEKPKPKKKEKAAEKAVETEPVAAEAEQEEIQPPAETQ